MVHIDHDHQFHGPKCPAWTGPNGVCPSDCLEICWAHGLNCKVGICMYCLAKHHFKPELQKNQKRVK